MTATRTPGVPLVEDGYLISTNPATGAEVGRYAVADSAAVDAAVARARDAALWWARLGFAGRRERLLRWRSVIANGMYELAELINAEGGKPVAEGIVEIAAAVDHLAFAAKRARKVLGLRRVRSSIPVMEHSAFLEYQPYGVIGVIGPWNYPIH